jgi:ATP-dependent exoDNAse (exonuclease V) beta subunit
LPHFNARTQTTREEEQRLAYVAMTRASDALVLTWTDSRNGKRTGPSLLLRDIPTGEPVVAPPPQSLRDLASQRHINKRHYEALAEWRRNAARAVRADVSAIISDKQLKQLADTQPQTLDAVAEITGTMLANRHGQRIIDVLRESVDREK